MTYSIHPRSLTPTMPSIALAGRSELIGGQAFVEGVLAGNLWAQTLAGWFQTHMVSPGRMRPTALVREPGAGVIAMGGHPTDERFVEAVMRTACDRVTTALRRLIGSPADDRFLVAAIHTDRVRRVVMGGESRWVARPSSADRLSDIVLSLFAVDALEHRESYDADLSVCDDCGRVGFVDGVSTRRNCAEHRTPVRRSEIPPRSNAPAARRPGSGWPPSTRPPEPR